MGHPPFVHPEQLPCLRQVKGGMKVRVSPLKPKAGLNGPPTVCSSRAPDLPAASKGWNESSRIPTQAKSGLEWVTHRLSSRAADLPAASKGWNERSRIPTQAKSGLEWATHRLFIPSSAEGSAVQQTRPGNVFDDDWKDKFLRQGTALAAPQCAENDLGF